MTRPRRRFALLTVVVLLVGVPATAQAQLGVPGHPAPEPPPPPPAPPPPPPEPAALPAAEPVPVVPTPPPPQPSPPPPEPPAPPPVAAPPAAETPAPASAEPLAGFSDGTAFLRSPDNDFVLFPGGRLQTDFLHLRTKNKAPNDTFWIRRARLELNGWIGGWAFFSLQGDFASSPPAGAAPAAPAAIATSDSYVGIAPWGTLAMLQVGQFDAPFTLENRTSDKYFDFMERSITVRAFGVPTNKEIGGMVHGYNDARNAYYSLGVFNGDGQNFKNVDDKFNMINHN